MHAPVVSPYRARLAQIPVVRRAVEIDGRTTHYWEYGPADASKTVLAIHGFRGDHHGLESFAAFMPGVRTIVPDLPGFGASASLPHSDIESYANWLHDLWTALGLSADTVLLGHSFGSIITAAAVASGLHPSLLALVNPIAAPALEGPRGVATAIAVGYYRLGAALPRPLGLALLRNRIVVRGMSLAMVKTRERGLRRWVHDQHDRYFSAFSDRTSVLEGFKASVTHDVSEYADRIDVPVLMIAAERDDITAVPEQRALANRIRDAELVVIPEVGHLTHYETPGAVVDAILRRMSDEGHR